MTIPEEPMPTTYQPSALELLKKPNDFLVMIPKAGKLPMLARKMYNSMLHSTQIQILEIRNKCLKLDAGTFFSARLTDLSASVTANKSNTIDLVKDYLSDMRKLEVDWRAPDANSPVVWKSMGMLSEVDLLKRDGAYWVSWSYPPTLFEAILDMRVYTQIDQTVIAQLTSYAAIALYEICARYKHNPSGLTAKQSPEWWVDALTGTAPKIDKKTGVPMKRREWRKFKESSLPGARDEINRVSDIEIELIETKTGKAVTSVQFQVTFKRIKTQKAVRNMSSEILEQAGKSDIPLSMISSFLNNGQSEEVMLYGLRALENRTNAPHLPTIANKAAYLKTVLFDADARVKHDDQNQPSNKLGLPKEKPVKSWEETRRAEVIEEFLALAKNIQKPYVLGAVDRLRDKGLLTPSTQRKLDEESWEQGLLLHEAVIFYAISTYGSNWLNDVTTTH
ncbi:replication initiation protein [Rhodoferax antarcticus]|uniref:Uncharacterized protein n=1 Tax=Rhodoferax antarcticus ANT.BR TaxID=1111071 RepID=A0A1Q8Y9C3_9BURK|nr:replication initiation protein [Rhodoferax antarcticus]OLP04646.1 hypothetical protein BLL52_4108 [Rhodoferax antarcticus ANT.BR]